MTRCIVHIGMHKTGSTSIQQSLSGFSDERFVYASLDMPNHSLAVYSIFASRPDRHHLHRAAGLDIQAVNNYAERMRLALDQCVASLRGRTLLISGEDISILPPESLARLHDYLRSRLGKVTIVGYVRPPAAFISSGFQQRVQSGLIVQVAPEREYRQYKEFFGAFDEIFGRENVRLWKFDQLDFPGGCAVRDFCSRLGIALPRKRICRLNDSLSWQSIAMLYVYSKLRHKYGFSILRAPEAQEMCNRLAIFGGDKFRFSPGVIKPVLDKNRKDIEWMENRLGTSLHEELGEHQLSDVRDEVDLIRPDPTLVGRLLAILRDASPPGIEGKTPDEVFLLAHALREKLLQEQTMYQHGVETGMPLEQSRSRQNTTARKTRSMIVALSRKLTTPFLVTRRSSKKP